MRLSVLCNIIAQVLISSPLLKTSVVIVIEVSAQSDEVVDASDFVVKGWDD